MLTFYRDAAALAAAREEQLRPAGYEETFDCIACTLVTNGEPHYAWSCVMCEYCRAGLHLLPSLPSRLRIPRLSLEDLSSGGIRHLDSCLPVTDCHSHMLFSHLTAARIDKP